MNCNCTGGLLVDCEGTPGGSVLPGSPCDDNNPFTTDDAYDANCDCIGTLPTACDGSPGGLEGLIVETYYIAEPNDAADTDGMGNLIQGATTYRIYVDMAPGYTLEAVYGAPAHTLEMQTSTFFYNQEDRGEATGDLIDGTRLDENTLAIDSWLTFGAAADGYWGVPKVDDPDGSIVGGANNDGGSNAVPGGLLVNNDPNAGVELTVADGLVPMAASGVTTIGFANLDAFETNTESLFTTNSGAWSVLGGIAGLDPAGENRILIAQVTTNGDFSFELNMRLGVPGGGTEDWVASNPQGAERTCSSLTYLNVACPPFGTACDDGDPNTQNDTEDGFCNCVGEVLDCEGVAGGSALPGTTCDDGDINTVG
ncbi:MAG: hypothetical protein KDB87_19885, partial [Flavobacteriales bacterium]|nr:hypothetical protein [Flavobacteriales bacterium]